jgi:Calcineurin-like phosphoesterase
VSTRARQIAFVTVLVALLLASAQSNGRVGNTDAIAAGDPVIVAAGDICGSPTDCAPTAQLIGQIAPTRVLPLGDNAYVDGTLAEYNAFYDPNWGPYKSITNPIPGNHEYHTANAQGYYDYFGARARAPYYSYDLGSWHLIALTGDINVSAGSDQEIWLKKDLAANPNRCVLAYWHEPRFTSGTVHSSDTSFNAFWRDLYAARADVVLNGHVHNYERFAKQNPDGQPVANGIREFVVGTGGASHYTSGAPIANSQIQNDTTFGVLKLTLHPGSYDWKFVPIAGETFTDSGSTTCSGAAPSSSAGTTGSKPPSRRYIYNSGSDQSGAAQNGWNLLDVGSKSAADALPAGTRGLVWVNDYDNTTCSWQLSDSALTDEVTGAIGDTKVAGYFFSDEPDPDACPTAVADHKARSALIHSLDPAKFTVMVADMNSDQASLDQIPLWKGAADFVGLDPYPCRPNEPCTYSWIRQVIARADKAGLRYWGVAQAFDDDNWRWPTPGEEGRMLTMWALSNQRGYMTFAWTWNNNDLTSRPRLLRVLRLYNTGALPKTRITDSPPSPTRSRRATFRFVSSIPGSRFRCKLDRRPWRRCTSPRVYTGLSRGTHTFRVRATVFGRRDPTPAHRSWTIR